MTLQPKGLGHKAWVLVATACTWVQGPALSLSLLSVCCCGHADASFFLELGFSAPTGPREPWLQAPDALVVQSIHETVPAAMK